MWSFALPAALTAPASLDGRARVLERHDVREAIGITAPIAIVVAIASIVLFATSSPGRMLAGVIAIIALIVIWRLGDGLLRRRPHIAAFALITVILEGRIITMHIDNGPASFAEAYFGLIVIGSAVFLPWSSRWHGSWLALAGASYLVTAFTVPAVEATRMYGIAFAATAIAISFAGNVLVRTRRRRTFSAELSLRDQRGELREAQIRLKAAAHEDPLTGLANRRRLNEEIAILESRLSRGRFGVAAIMVDLDAFKAYNDSVGHLAGDQVLRAIATAIRNAVRPADRVYRYGGEEILVLMEEDSLDAALSAAERVVRSVRALPIVHPTRASGLMTVSAGTAASGGRLMTPWALIDEADRALYEAKAGGGDRAAAFRHEGDGGHAHETTPTSKRLLVRSGSSASTPEGALA